MAIVSFAAWSCAAAMPAAVATEFPALRPMSEASFHKYFFHVYDVTLWTEAGTWKANAPHALEIRYAMAVSGRDLAKRSVEEIARQGPVDAAVLDKWQAEMTRVFPDIRPGDRLTGIAIPGREARFYAGERLAGTIADAAFTEAFFAIWLGERTSEPVLRARLLKRP